MSDWEIAIVDDAVSRLMEQPHWCERLKGWRDGLSVGFAWHLAVFSEPFLSYVLDGTKKVESRFSVNRAEPFGRVKTGDIILLKESGGPVVGAAEVREVSFYTLNRDELERIRERFGEALRVEDEAFWDDRSSACYASIMRLDFITPFAPLPCEKRDKRGWVRLEYQPTLGF